VEFFLIPSETFPIPSLEPTMRQSRPPVRFSQGEYVAKAQKTELHPSQGQSTKISGIVRLPEINKSLSVQNFEGWIWAFY